MDSLLPEGYEADKWYSKNDPFMDMKSGYWYFRFIRYADQGKCCALRFDYLTYGPFDTKEIAEIVQSSLKTNVDRVQFDWEEGNRDRADQIESEAARNNSTAPTIADV